MSFSEFRDMLRDPLLDRALRASRASVNVFLADPACPLAVPAQRRLFRQSFLRNAHVYHQTVPEPRKEVMTLLLAMPALSGMDADRIVADYGEIVCALHAELREFKDEEVDLSPLASEAAYAMFGFMRRHFDLSKHMMETLSHLQPVIDAMALMRDRNQLYLVRPQESERHFSRLRILSALPVDTLKPN